MAQKFIHLPEGGSIPEPPQKVRIVLKPYVDENDREQMDAEFYLGDNLDRAIKHNDPWPLFQILVDDYLQSGYQVEITRVVWGDDDAYGGKLRSKTLEGIAQAMAEQWGRLDG